MSKKKSYDFDRPVRSRAGTRVIVRVLAMFLVFLLFAFLASMSFYKRLIDSNVAYNDHVMIDRVEKTDFSDTNFVNDVRNLETEKNLHLCIYEYNDGNIDYNNPYFSAFVENKYKTEGRDYSSFTGHKRTINFFMEKFTEKKPYKDNPDECYGIYTDPLTKVQFSVMTRINRDKNLLIMVSRPQIELDATAHAFSSVFTFVLLFIFLVMSVIVFFFSYRITTPLKIIRDVTCEMAECKDPTLRIPPRRVVIKTETDETMASINYLYESLKLAQNQLKERNQILLQQLREIEAEEEARVDFIASTSHELKTPISIIQGFAEGIGAFIDDRDTVLEYSTTIIDECHKMTTLIMNMMSLSKLQSGSVISCVDFSLTEFVRERLKIHSLLMEKAGITVINSVKESYTGYGDAEKISYVINNLLSNAIAYIGGEKIIEISAEDLGDRYRIYVFNTGKQIPDSEIQKMWDSFYRMDTVRNRSAGHFGLGLSIVKSVQNAHHQLCGVENRENGVAFWFDVQKSGQIPPDDA